MSVVPFMHLDYPSIEPQSTPKQKDKEHMIIALPFTAVQQVHNHIIDRGVKKSQCLTMLEEFDKVRSLFILLTFENNSFSPMTISVQYLGHQLPRWLRSSFMFIPVHTQFPLACSMLLQLPDFQDSENTFRVRQSLLILCPQWPAALLHSSTEEGHV